MKLRVLSLLLIVAVSTAAAQAEAPDLEEQVAESKSLLERLADGASDAAQGVGHAVEDTGRGIGKAASGVGALFASAASAVGNLAQAASKGIVVAGLAASLGLAAAIVAAGSLAGSAFASIGLGATSAFIAVGSGLASAAVFAGGLLADLARGYLDAISFLRPPGMSPALFTATAAGGAAATGGVGAWSLWSILRKYGWVASGLGGVAGFSRIADDELLQHPMRQRIFQVIQENPGIHASGLARAAGSGWGTIVHHLDKLEKGGLVATRKVNNQKCYFEMGGKVSRQDMAIASAVRQGTANHIASFVTSHPMTSQKMLAENLGISPALTSFHVKKLVHQGVLDRVRHGKEILLTTSESMRRILASEATPAATVTMQQAGLQLA